MLSARRRHQDVHRRRPRVVTDPRCSSECHRDATEAPPRRRIAGSDEASGTGSPTPSERDQVTGTLVDRWPQWAVLITTSEQRIHPYPCHITAHISGLPKAAAPSLTPVMWRLSCLCASGVARRVGRGRKGGVASVVGRMTWWWVGLVAVMGVRQVRDVSGQVAPPSGTSTITCRNRPWLRGRPRVLASDSRHGPPPIRAAPWAVLDAPGPPRSFLAACSRGPFLRCRRGIGAHGERSPRCCGRATDRWWAGVPGVWRSVGAVGSGAVAHDPRGRR
jgi:hypothetical protein